jgi:hypothetical protein
MKHTLGRLCLLVTVIFLHVILLHAEDFSYALSVDKQKPYVKEAVLLTLDVNQTNPTVVLLFDFDLAKDDSFTYQRVGIEEITRNHNLHIRYTYLVYPLHDNKVTMNFKFRKRVTTDDSVAYSFSGDRDNVKGLVTKDYTIVLEPLTLNVKPLPEDVMLVGNFTLDSTLKKHQAKAYEALPFTVIIKGEGYPPLLDTIVSKDVNFTLFTEKPIVKTFSNAKGTQSSVSYAMALSHETSFILPAISLKAFNPLSEKMYTLTLPSQHFIIDEVNKSTLLDTVNSPPLQKEDWRWVKTLFTYLLIFISGYFTAKAFQWPKKSKKEAMTHPFHILIEKIQHSKNEKDLLQILLASNKQCFTPCIEMLENSMYSNGKINLTKVKAEALGLL